jgi:ribonuclease HII
MTKIRPTTKREVELWDKGYLKIAGIDEAGRGAWAGPVVAAAVVIDKNHKTLNDITDSKLLSPKKRVELYEIVTENVSDFGVGIVDHITIDKIGILNATKLASKQAVEMLKSSPDYLLTDALDLKDYVDIFHEAHIKGDQKIYSISCASIIAKVTRDNIMESLDGGYERYAFGKHKGYGTKLHMEKLDEFGVSDIHRKSYKPIKKYLLDE